MNRRTPRIGIGTVSLIVILSSLCLTIFALLTLLTALNDQRLAVRTAETTLQYYAADTRAAHIRRAVEQAAQAGALPGQVDGVTLEQSDGEVRFVCPLGSGDSLQLAVALRLTPDGATQVHAWRTEAAGDWQADTDIRVWDGEGE